MYKAYRQYVYIIHKLIINNIVASIKRGISYLMHNRTQFCDSIVKNFFAWLPDKQYLSLRFRFQMGRWVDWKNPTLYQDKLQWLKIYNRQERYTEMVDKVAVKKYVARIIGEKYIIPTLGVWSHFDDIDFDTLPNQFVLKTNNGGGCPKTYWDIKQIALVNFYFFYYSCLTLYIIETQLFCLYL